MSDVTHDWLRALRDPAWEDRDRALRDMDDFIRRTLGRGFGRQLSDADLADLRQESLVRVHQKHEGFRGDSKFSTWVASVAVNTALLELRRRRHRHVELSAAVEAGAAAIAAPDGSRRLEVAQRNEKLRLAIESALTERQREALLASLSGMPMMELARRLGSNRGALYKLLHDARLRLRAHLEAEGETLQSLLVASPQENPI